MMGFPSDFFPVLFCIGRTAGWLAHWKESLVQKTPIFRPQQDQSLVIEPLFKDENKEIEYFFESLW